MDILCNNINCDGIGMRRADWDNFRECQDIVLNGQVIWERPVLSSAVKSQIYTEYAANPTLASQIWKAANVYAKAHPAMIDTINANPTWYWGDFIYFYQQVEWIGFSGNNSNSSGQYINTDIYPNATQKYILKCNCSTGSTGASSGASGKTIVRFNGSTAASMLYYGDGNARTFSYTNAAHIYIFDYINKIVSVDNIQQSMVGIAQFSSVQFVLGAWLEGGTRYYRITGKVYEFEILSNNENIRKYYPCYNKSSQIIGMFDVVNGVFYTNQGTGTFTKGADI